MTAVFFHEIRLLFSGLTAYVYGAFSLFFVAVYMMYYNLSAAYANFEYALAGASFAFVLMIPIITMRIIAEEKKAEDRSAFIRTAYHNNPDRSGKISGSISHLGDPYVYCNRLSSDSSELWESLSSYCLRLSCGYPDPGADHCSADQKYGR